MHTKIETKKTRKKEKETKFCWKILGSSREKTIERGLIIFEFRAKNWEDTIYWRKKAKNIEWKNRCSIHLTTVSCPKDPSGFNVRSKAVPKSASL